MQKIYDAISAYLSNEIDRDEAVSRIAFQFKQLDTPTAWAIATFIISRY